MRLCTEPVQTRMLLAADERSSKDSRTSDLIMDTFLEINEISQNEMAAITLPTAVLRSRRPITLVTPLLCSAPTEARSSSRPPINATVAGLTIHDCVLPPNPSTDLSTSQRLSNDPTFDNCLQRGGCAKHS